MYKDIFESIRNEAEKRNLRERTIQLYCSDVSYFLRWIGKNVSDLTLEDAESFLTAKRLEIIGPEIHNHYGSAIKFLYKKVLKTVWDDDISRTNMTIHVRETKGRIDRYTILSQKNLDLLTEYWYKCGRPKDILFPSSWTGGYLDITGVNQFFKKSAKLAGITRHVSSHACRHSFASHLFESGTDIKYIQSLLGHVDPRSTDVYLHVSNKTLLGIRSPFDNPEGGES